MYKQFKFLYIFVKIDRPEAVSGNVNIFATFEKSKIVTSAVALPPETQEITSSYSTWRFLLTILGI